MVNIASGFGTDITFIMDFSYDGVTGNQTEYMNQLFSDIGQQAV